MAEPMAPPSDLPMTGGSANTVAPSDGQQVALRPAASVILLRDAPGGIEVFMVQRNRASAFVPGHHVFPGGALDAADQDSALHRLCVGHDDLSASRILRVPQGGLAFWVAAIRECFEEAGLLLAGHGPGSSRLELSAEQQRDVFQSWRARLNAGQASMLQLCQEFELMLLADRLQYFSHWITPIGNPRRFDTRFFVAEAPADQAAMHDGAEAIDHVWVRPAQALDMHRQGRFPLVYATRTTLEQLADFGSVAQVLDHARKQREVATIMPRIGHGRAGRRVIGPGEAVYAEIGKVDQFAPGQASYEIVPGQPARLGPRLWRLTAPNPGYMTGPGTNTYLIGDECGVTVIDPGPDEPAHLQRILEVAPGPIRDILVTHTHQDHSPGARYLREATGARTIGWPTSMPNQDVRFQPDYRPAHDERLDTAGCTLRVLHTPGHASNHLCYLWEAERLLFTGDHIMQGSTVVISPPDGDMGTYLHSLEALLREPVDWLAPAHGFLMDEPQKVINQLMEHRLRRESLIVRALRGNGAVHRDVLLARVYTQLPAPLVKVAARTLLAHLLKLERENRVRRVDEDHWEFSDPAMS